MPKDLKRLTPMRWVKEKQRGKGRHSHLRRGSTMHWPKHWEIKKHSAIMIYLPTH